MSINIKLERNRKNPLIKVFIEAEISSIFSDNKEIENG